MTDELREAAERVREVRRTNKSSVYAGVHPRAFNPFAVDNQLLADAYLAEHPADDDTPLDETWLLTVGGSWFGDHLGIELQGSTRLEVMRDCGVIESGFRNKYIGGFVPIDGGITTRGQLRRLCSSLGIELKEGKA